MKGAKFKNFFLNHGEKLAFGLFVVLALVVLTGTTWSTYEKTPLQLSEAAEKGQQAINVSRWPEEEKTKLTDWSDIRVRGRDMLVGINAEAFEPSTEMFVPVYPRSQPILQPKYYTVDKPVAKPGIVMIEMAPPLAEDSLLADAADPAAPKKTDDEEFVPSDFRTRKPATGTDGMSAESAYTLNALIGETPAEMNMADPSYMTEGMTTVKKSLFGEGYRFVAVRATLDLQAQKAAFAKAMHLPPDEAARLEPRIIGFEIERQKAQPSGVLWAGPWVPLDITNSLEVLQKAIDIEPEVIDISLTDPAITSPLPRRVFGEWGSYATCEAVENYKLSPEEQAAEQARIQRLIELQEAIRKQSGTMGQLEPVEVEGFGKFVRNTRAMESSMGEMMGPGNSAYTEAYRSVEQEYANDMSAMGMAMETSGSRRGQSNLLTGKRSAASGRLLLFRYFDFDVEPGEAYRYRIRIKYANPNYGRRIDTLAQPEFAEEPYGFSDWSDPTLAEASEQSLVAAQKELSETGALVHPEAEYYLTKIEDVRGVQGLSASMEIFQWSREFGSELHQALQLNIGDAIGVETKSKVVNLLEETYEEQKVVLKTNDFVIDLIDNVQTKIDPNLPGLSAIPNDIRLDQAVVLNRQGQIKTIDPLSFNSGLRDARKRISLYQNLGKKFEEASVQANSAESLFGAEESAMMESGSYPGATNKRGRRSNAASIKSRSSSYP